MARVDSTHSARVSEVTAPAVSSDEVYSRAVLRMPKKPAIELVDARTLSLHSLFALLTTVCMTFAAAVWTAYATSQSTGWMLASAVMLTFLSLVFLFLATLAWWRMRSKRHNIEVPLSGIGDLSRLARRIYLGSEPAGHQDQR